MAYFWLIVGMSTLFRNVIIMESVYEFVIKTEVENVLAIQLKLITIARRN